jgi:hypothetical protein
MPALPLEDDWLGSVEDEVEVEDELCEESVDVEDDVCEADEVPRVPCVDAESALPVDVVDDVSVDDPLLAASEPATVAIPPFDVVCDRNPVASGVCTFASA